MDILAILPMPPFRKPRMTIGDRKRCGKNQRPEVARYWQGVEELQIRSAGKRLKLGFSLSLVFVIKVPESWSKKKKKEKIGTFHDQTPDLSNIVKAFEDALYEDDKKIHSYVDVHKIWGDLDLIVVCQQQEQNSQEIYNLVKSAENA